MKFIKLLQNFIGWIFITCGILILSRYLVGGLVFISWGLLILPIVNKFIKNKGFSLNLWKRLGITFLGFCLLLVFPPPNLDDNPQDAVVNPTHNSVPGSTTTATTTDGKTAPSSESINGMQSTKPKSENTSANPKKSDEVDTNKPMTSPKIEPKSIVKTAHKNKPTYVKDTNDQYMVLLEPVGNLGQLRMQIVSTDYEEVVPVLTNCIDLRQKGTDADVLVGESVGIDATFKDYSSWIYTAARSFCSNW